MLRYSVIVRSSGRETESILPQIQGARSTSGWPNNSMVKATS